MRRLLAAASALVVLAAGTALAAPAESFLDIPGPQGPIKGTLLAAEAPNAPVVVIIPGSGPTDRDGNNPLGVAGKPYRLLAEALAERGVTTLRADKRGMFASAGAIPDANAITIADYAGDAHAWASLLKQKTGAPCVWLLGHSEGALVAAVAAQDPTDLCGLVLVSGGGRRLSDVLREQIAGNPANPPELKVQAEHAISELEAGRRVDTAGMHPALQPLFYPAVQGFLVSMFSYDPAALVKAYKGPVLVVQGTTDIQVTLADARRLASARPGVKLVELEGVNHLLKVAPADRAANLATYADPSLPLAPGVADPIAAFVKARH
jgi:pimeloyl-ACP methyl ester carboxylesterase